MGYNEYFASRISPDQPAQKLKRGKLVATPLTEVRDLKYCKGFVARLFASIAGLYARFADKLLANSMNYLPLRFLMIFLHYNAVQAEGFIEACNGHFWRGIRKILFKK